MNNKENTALTSVEVFNPLGGEEEEWEECMPMTRGRRCFRLYAKRGKMYAIGGENYLGGRLNTVEAYDSAEETWTFVASMNHRRADFGNQFKLIELLTL